MADSGNCRRMRNRRISHLRGNEREMKGDDLGISEPLAVCKILVRSIQCAVTRTIQPYNIRPGALILCTASQERNGEGKEKISAYQWHLNAVTVWGFRGVTL